MAPATPTFRRALAARERRSPALIVLLVVLLALGAAAGYGTGSLDAGATRATQPTATTTRAATGQSTDIPLGVNTLELSAGFCALLAALLVVERAAEDRATGWMSPLVALHASRRTYVLWLFATVTLEAVAAFWGTALAFAAGAAVGGHPAWGLAARMATGGSLNIASLAAYGLALSMLTRSRLAAIVLGVVAYALPVGAMMVYMVRADAYVLPAVRHLLMLHLPPLSYGTAPALLATHAAYAAAVLALATGAAHRAVARHS